MGSVPYEPTNTSGADLSNMVTNAASAASMNNMVVSAAADKTVATVESIQAVARTTTVGAGVKLLEGSDNGNHGVTIKAPAAVTSDRTVTAADADVDLANVPSADEKDALTGTSGTAPSGTNKFVDNADTRLVGLGAGLLLSEPASFLVDDLVSPLGHVVGMGMGECFALLTSETEGQGQASIENNDMVLVGNAAPMTPIWIDKTSGALSANTGGYEMRVPTMKGRMIVVAHKASIGVNDAALYYYKAGSHFEADLTGAGTTDGAFETSAYVTCGVDHTPA